MQDVTGITNMAYDAAGRRAAVVNGAGLALTHGYDATGNRTGMVDPDGGVTTCGYDADGRLTGIDNPYAELTTVGYDALGREYNRVLANGVLVSHSYDAGGREVGLAQVGPDGAARGWHTASYDATGNLLGQAELDGSVVSYGYDAADQLTHEVRGGTEAYDITYLYAAAGNRVAQVDSGQITTYLYNAANEMALVTPVMGDNRRDDRDTPGRERTDEDWERQAQGLVGRIWQRFGGGLPVDDREDCLSEALAAAVALCPRLEVLPPGDRVAYAEVVLGRAVRAFLRREQEARRRTVALEGLRTDDGERREWPASSDTEAEAMVHLDLAQQVSDGRLAAAIRALKPSERKILDLCYRDGQTDDEIGGVVGLSADAVWRKRASIIQRSRDVMKRTKLAME